MSPAADQFAELAGRIRALAEELADLALDRLYDAAERGSGDKDQKVAEERRLTRAARALEKAASDLEVVSGSSAE